MVRFKYYRCVLLWCSAFTAILFIFSLNSLLWYPNLPDETGGESGDRRTKWLPPPPWPNFLLADVKKLQDYHDYYGDSQPQQQSWPNNVVAQENPPTGNEKNRTGSSNGKNQTQNYRLTDPEQKPWFMTNGTVRPVPMQPPLAIWPGDIVADDENDRIVNQLMYVPQHYDEKNFYPHGRRSLKKILLAYGRRGWSDLELGRKRFLQDRCPVNACFLMANPGRMGRADAVIFKDRFVWPKSGGRRPSGVDQRWILFLLESPHNTQLFSSLPPDLFNWTATYRHDSDIVTPYEKYVRYDSIGYRPTPAWESPVGNQTKKNYAAGKTKKVAWFVSNCGARNKRLEYAKELSKYIDVDIFGSCGKNRCPRTSANECFAMLNRDYKFYLAFENSNCRDYITEKFFVNGLGHHDSGDINILPVVMGAPRDDYRRVAPPNSFIHVDDFESPGHLAQYLWKLDNNDDAYNRYFEWKSTYRPQGEFINTYFWCRLCALLHADDAGDGQRNRHKSYRDMDQWWAPKHMCNDGTKPWSPPPL